MDIKEETSQWFTYDGETWYPNDDVVCDGYGNGFTAVDVRATAVGDEIVVHLEDEDGCQGWDVRITRTGDEVGVDLDRWLSSLDTVTRRWVPLPEE